MHLPSAQPTEIGLKTTSGEVIEAPEAEVIAVQTAAQQLPSSEVDDELPSTTEELELSTTAVRSAGAGGPSSSSARDTRAPALTASFSGIASSTRRAAAAADGQTGIHCDAEHTPEAPAAPVTKAELMERSAIMFVVGSPAPVASGRKSAIKKATKELVTVASDVVFKLPIEALSTSFGNFDKLVALGWLLGDVVCGKLIEHTDAHRIGRAMSKKVAEFKADFTAPHRRVGKRKYPDGAEEKRQRDLEAAAEEEANERCAEITPPLDFGDAPAEAQERRPAATAASDAVKLEKKVRAADSAVQLAEANLTAAKREAGHAAHRYDQARDRAHKAAISKRMGDERKDALIEAQQQAADTYRKAGYIDAEFEADSALRAAKNRAADLRIDQKWGPGGTMQKWLEQQEKERRANYMSRLGPKPGTQSKERERELDEEHYMRAVLLATSRGRQGEQVRATLVRMGFTLPPGADPDCVSEEGPSGCE